MSELHQTGSNVPNCERHKFVLIGVCNFDDQPCEGKCVAFKERATSGDDKPRGLKLSYEVSLETDNRDMSIGEGLYIIQKLLGPEFKVSLGKGEWIE